MYFYYVPWIKLLVYFCTGIGTIDLLIVFSSPGTFKPASNNPYFLQTYNKEGLLAMVSLVSEIIHLKKRPVPLSCKTCAEIVWQHYF